MPTKQTTEKARRAKNGGKAPTTQAGEFVHDEIDRIRHGEHGARSAKQAIAVGLSKARRAGVGVPAPKKGKTSEKTRKAAERDLERGHGKPPKHKSSTKRGRASLRALKHEPTSTVSRDDLSKQAKSAARKRTATERSAAAEKAVRTKGTAGRSAAARKAARTRTAHKK